MNTDLELFKQALSEGLNLRIQSGITSCAEKLICSKEHRAAMAEILGGTYKKPLTWSSTRTKIAAILVAAMMLLAGCTVLYKDEIRDFIEHIYEEYIEISFSDGKYNDRITQIYELTYVPEGYELNDSYSSATKVRYVFSNQQGDELIFSQSPLNTSYGYNNEGDYSSKVIIINDYAVYCIKTDINYTYLWNNGKHSMQISTNTAISTEELRLIIEGIQSK